MSSKIRVPLLPESVSDATIAIWVKKVGDKVKEEEVLLELETDKVILEVTAPVSGVLSDIIEIQGAIVHSGDVIGLIAVVSTQADNLIDKQPVDLVQQSEVATPNQIEAAVEKHIEKNVITESMPEQGQEESLQPVDVVMQSALPIQEEQENASTEIRRGILQELEQIQEEHQEFVEDEIQQDPPVVETQAQPEAVSIESNNKINETVQDDVLIPSLTDSDSPFASPSVRKAMAEYEIKAEMIKGSGKHGKILKEDIEQHLQTPKETSDEEVINELIETFSEKAEVQPIEEGNAGGVAIAEAVLAEETSDLKEDIDLLIESNNEEKIAEKLNESPPEKKEDEINDMEDANEVDEETTHKEKNEQQQETTDLPIATVTENKTINSVNEALAGGNGSERRVPMTRLRAKIAERLVAAQQTAAILTTFNDVDLSEIIRLRKIYRDRFEQVHGIKLGFMSFFVKAATEALKRYPEVNARIDGQDVVYQGNYDIGVAVSTERGLVVPVVRDTNTLGHAEIEKKIHDYAYRARNNQLELNELTGGTFSITNGGVFGSMLSTPIINPPQSAILGMHKIEDRPVAIKGEVVIRPMMYLALSYDHRLIDGKTAVSFLVKIKELLEDPASLFLEL